MNVGSWTGYEQLESALARQVDEVCEHFEAAWRDGKRPAVEAHVGNLPEPLGLVLARELILLDVAYRRRAGETPAAGDYAARFPALDAAWLVQVIDGPTVVTPLLLATEPTAPLPADAVPGYEILGELGRGGMGVVYRARDVRLGRSVALKFLTAEAARDPWRLSRFWREARAACALNHPAVCTLHDVGEHQGRPFLVLEWVDGQTLRSLVSPTPELGRLLPVVRQVAEALRVAHAAGIVHRDIKPENLMVRPDGYVKVLDFGLARLLPDLAGAGPAAPSADTDPGLLVGTVAYMAPEQARAANVGGAADIFSLGVVLYELTTGRRPFEAASPFTVLHQIQSDPPLPPTRFNPAIPPPLEALILQMLSKAPHLRPTAAEVEAALRELAEGSSAPAGPTASPPRPTVGRATERAALRAAFDGAAAGRGLVLCVTGEPGIGKTTLVEEFLTDLAAADRLACRARGRCSERLGGAEAYLPVLEALGDLLRGPAAEAAARVMRLVAPTWYAQVVPPGVGDAAPAPGRASSQERLKQELLAFVQELTGLRPLVLFLEDVHWADESTVDLLAYLGARCGGLRLLVVLTYRPSELLLGKHPLHAVKLELQGRGLCREVRLGFLGRGDVDAYLALAFPGHSLPDDFAGLVHARTEGNPLFMVDLVRELRERGVIADGPRGWGLVGELPALDKELPETIRGLIQRKIDRLDEADRRLLAAASVQGPEFDSAAVAGALAADPAAVEERLQALDQVHGLVRLVREQELPDGTLTLRYGFVHVLYQETLYHALPPSRRAAWSAALAEALLRHYRDQAATVAAELACLFETARDFARAARHFHLAALNAARVFAHREAVVLARRGLRLLQAAPDPAARAALELPLQMTLGLQLQVTEGYAAPQAKQAYTRAYDLCQHHPDLATRFSALWGLWLYYKVRSDLPRARELADELFALARDHGDPALIVQSQQALTVTTLCLGQPVATRDHMDRGTAVYDPARHRTLGLQFGQDPGVACRAFGAVALWLLGRPDQAVQVSREAVRLGHDLSQPSTQALALHFAAMLHQCRREPREVLTFAELAITVAAEQGFSFWHAGGTVLRGWALAATGVDAGLDLIRQGLADWQATGSVTYQTYYLALLADVLLTQGRTAEAGAVLDEALAVAYRTAEGLFEPELYRLKGETARGTADAEPHFRLAYAIARRQGSTALALRAAMSLARLLGPPARPTLADVYGAFAEEGHDTPDLKDAAALLRELT